VKGQWLVAFLSGGLFALGLGVAGMTRPEKVLGFLDLLGDWDPSLALVMVGAIAVHALAHRVRTGRPLLGGTFQLPTRRDIDVRLVMGAALFGVGWGLAGYCPGPGLVSLAGPLPVAALFVGAMLGGMALFGWYDRAFRPGSRLA
jgi:uncharacterized membrane protein YedE/YeeE